MLKYIIEKKHLYYKYCCSHKKTKEKRFYKLPYEKTGIQTVTKVIEEYELEGKLIHIKSVNLGNINKTYVAYFEKK